MTKFSPSPSPWCEAYKEKTIPPEKLAEKVAELKELGTTIATLNGSFDLMHAGHLHIIYEASKAADVLIVALNTDRSIRSYKSIHRPIIPLEYRVQMMCALQFVDYVTWFDETDPRSILEIIQPNVHINGPEYGSACIEAETVKKGGGVVQIVQLIPGLSTSQVIETIRKLP